MENLLSVATKVARFLEEQKIPYAVIEGLALQHWGEPRYTRDVDITVFVPPERLPEFLDQTLARFSPRIPNAKAFALRHRVVLLKVEEVPVDISLGISGYEEEALARAVAVEFPGVGVLRLLAPEDLLIHKCMAGRPRDLEDVESILNSSAPEARSSLPSSVASGIPGSPGGS